MITGFVSNSATHGLQHARLSCPSLSSKLAQIHVHWAGDAVQSSHPLPPLLLLPSVFSSIRVFSNELAFCIMWPLYWNFSFSIRPSTDNIYIRRTGTMETTGNKWNKLEDTDGNGFQNQKGQRDKMISKDIWYKMHRRNSPNMNNICPKKEIRINKRERWQI